jgi:hypothetical protein
MPPSPSWKAVYAVIERGPRKHWLRVGMAFVNRDGSLNVRLDAMPLSGQLQIRDPPSRSEGGENFADPPDAEPQPAGPAPTAGTDRKPRP